MSKYWNVFSSFIFSNVSISSDSNNDEDIIIFYHYYKHHTKKYRRKFWINPYNEKNMNCRLFVAAKVLQETDSGFLVFYRMRKETYPELHGH